MAEEHINTETGAEKGGFEAKLDRFMVARTLQAEAESVLADAKQQMQSAAEDLNTSSAPFTVELVYLGDKADAYVVGGDGTPKDKPDSFEANRVYPVRDQKLIFYNDKNDTKLYVNQDCEITLYPVGGETITHQPSAKVATQLGQASVDSSMLIDPTRPKVGKNWPWDRMSFN